MIRLAAAFALLAAPALAVTPVTAYRTSGGAVFVEVEGEAVPTLRSVEPVTYHVGAAGAPVSGTEVIRLRPDCTAESALVGEGHWFRTADGFDAMFVEGAGMSFDGVLPPPGAAQGC